MLQKTPYSFDVSVWEFFWPLMTGAVLVVARPGGHRDAGYVADLIAEERITTIHFVPPMLEAILEEPRFERCVSLTRVICSGEALTWDLQQRFFDRSRRRAAQLVWSDRSGRRRHLVGVPSRGGRHGRADRPADQQSRDLSVERGPAARAGRRARRAVDRRRGPRAAAIGGDRR